MGLLQPQSFATHPQSRWSISNLDLLRLREAVLNQSPAASPGYRPDIDGLRGVAVAAVVLFHGHLGVSGGYVGVDVFFVISGYLITRLILRAQDRSEFSLREFWLRRVRRLAPAVIVVVLASMLAGAWLMFPRDYYYFTKSSLAQVLLASNIHFNDYLDYFAGPAELQPLLHTWSLAVEEQFYLIFPLLLAIGRRWPRPRLAAGLAALALGSLAYSVYCVQHYPSAAFFLLPSRAWELVLGALLVFLPSGKADEPRWAWRWEAMSLAGLAGILAPCWLYDSNTFFPGAAALLPCTAAAAIIYGNTRRKTLVARWLAAPWLVGIGLISYSLYLWHWPIFSYLHYEYGEVLPPTVTAGALIMSLLCGYASWRWIETPFRRRRVVAADGALLRGVVACSLVIVAASIASLATRGLPGRWGESITQALQESGNVMKKYRTGRARLANEDLLPRIGAAESGSPTVLVWGDSHAAALGELCDALARKHGIVGHIASRGGTAPLLGAYRPKAKHKSPPWNAAVVEFVRRHQIQHVILVSRWSANISIRDNGHTDALITDAENEALTPAGSRQVMRRGLQRTVNALTDAGARVWIMKQVPHQDRDPFRLMIAADPATPLVTGVSRSEHLERQQEVERLFAQVKNATVLDPADFCFDAQGHSIVGTPEVCYYSDLSHLSTVGSVNLVQPLLEPVFQRISAASLARSTDDGGTRR